MPDTGGTFLGRVSNDHPYAQPFADVQEAIHPKRLGNLSPEDYMKDRPSDEEGYFTPGSELLWIHKKKSEEDTPMSALDPVENKNESS